MEFTDEQLCAAEKMLRDKERERQKEDARILTDELEEYFARILAKDFDVEPVSVDWISHDTLSEVAQQSIKSIQDFRHRYPFSISAFKYLSVTAFWIVKLKPINGLGIKRNDDWIDCPDINERVALVYIQQAIWKLLMDDQISEFLPCTEQVKCGVRKIFEVFFNDEMFNKSMPPKDDEGFRNNKSYETAYYMHFKKMTAINIYESLIHMLLPIKSGFACAEPESS